jgi:hypothetical protein
MENRTPREVMRLEKAKLDEIEGGLGWTWLGYQLSAKEWRECVSLSLCVSKLI